MKFKLLSILLLFMFTTLMSKAQTTFASPFSNNMVLQRNANVKIWGTDNPNTSITVTTSWNNQTYNTTAASDGKWSVLVSTPAGSDNAYSVTLQGTQTRTLTNVLIGEVWLCSGQSNMAMTFNYPENPVGTGDAISASATDDKIRIFSNNQLASLDEQDTFSATWRPLTYDTAKFNSMISYFYGKKLRAELGVPIGLINNAYGSATIEAWIDEVTLGTFDFVTVPDTFLTPRQKTPGVCYNAAIHPLVGYGIKGVIWYQGEANKRYADEYAQLLPALVNSWRQKWGIGNFPFYYVQIVPYQVFESDNLSFWNMMREAHYQIPNSGVVVTLDKPSCDQIHPPEKDYVADRLAYWALNKDYGFNSVVPSGPLATSVERIGSTLKVNFDYAETGLVAGSGGFTNFQVAGADQVYYNAQILSNADNTLTLSSASVPVPQYARYGAGTCASLSASLFSGVALPASPFIVEYVPPLSTSSFNKQSYSVYPNPTGDFIQISMPNTSASNVQFRLYDMLGQLVLEEQATPGKDKWQIKVKGLSKGIHVLEITTDNNQMMYKKLIKK